MRLILAAAVLTALALPAEAQRLDTRVREVRAEGMRCRLNANRAMLVERDASGANPRAYLFQPAVESDPTFDVLLDFRFQPRQGTRFNAGAEVLGMEMRPRDGASHRLPTSARLLLDGSDSRVKLGIVTDPIRPGSINLVIPEAMRAPTAERMLGARSIDFQMTGGDSPTTRTYRFDGLRITDSTEILSIIKFGCDGARAD